MRAARSHTFALLVACSAVGIVVLFLANLFCGSVSIPFGEVLNILGGGGAERATWGYIVLDSRLPQAVTALFAGASLAVAGLLLQTFFNNPLAGPSILGINTGASLGVSVVMLVMGGSIGGSMAGFTVSGYIAIVTGAFAGALAVLGVLIFFSTVVRSNVMLLIIGLMVGYLASSVISLLTFFSSSEGVFSYVIWGLGDFSGVSLPQLPFFCSTLGVGLAIALLLVKPMNALLLGERYAANLGVRVGRVRVWMFISTGILVATTTAFCGPVSFLGLAVPHMARLLARSSNHKGLLPATLLLGGVVALLCNLAGTLLGRVGGVPLNAIMPVLGAPVIIYVIVNQKKIQYFN